MGFFDLFKKSNKPISNKESEQPRVLNQTKQVIIQPDELLIHEGIKSLLWVANGPMKNYLPDKGSLIKFEVDGLVLTISVSGVSEPSLIDTNLEIYQVDDISNVERPPYFPSYRNLTGKQRGVYWKLLSNPYNDSIDIGYVFILYYGLERHLLLGDFEAAFSAILKLRDIHQNKSFQSYSGSALVLSCLYHQRPDMLLSFIASLDKEYKMSFSDNLFLLSAYSFGVKLYPHNIIRLARTFEFENKNYISRYPDLFVSTMDELLIKKHGKDYVKITDFISKNDLRRVSSEEMSLFANISLSDERIRLPRLMDSFKLKKGMYELLEETHQVVKIKLSELRKSGNAPQEAKKQKTNRVLVEDDKLEKELLEQLKSKFDHPVDRHFSYNRLLEFYYRYREVDDKYLQECIKYCLADVDMLDELQEAYIIEQKNMVNMLSSVYSRQELAEKVLKAEEGFIGSIPAFKRLAIIYEKNGSYIEAVEICDKAINYYRRLGMDDVEEFEKRKEKLLKILTKT